MKKILIPALMLGLIAASCSDKKDTSTPEADNSRHLVRIVDGESGASQSTTIRTKDGLLTAVVDSAGTDVSIDTLIYVNGRLYTIGEKNSYGEVSVDLEFVYNSNGKVTKVYNRGYEREHENVTDYDSIAYDAAGNPAKIFTKGGEAGQITEKMVKEFTWDANGNITSIKNGGFTGTGYVYFLKKEFSYDNNSNAIAKTDGSALIRYYLYDENLISANNTTRVVNYTDPNLSGNWVLNYLTTYAYTYDSDKYVTSVTAKEGATEAGLAFKAYYLFQYSK
jgi:hypothetical protein